MLKRGHLKWNRTLQYFKMVSVCPSELLPPISFHKFFLLTKKFCSSAVKLTIRTMVIACVRIYKYSNGCESACVSVCVCVCVCVRERKREREREREEKIVS